jgi:O-antigen/teichoic acid export membrane protein
VTVGDPNADPTSRNGAAPVSLRRNFSWMVLGEVVYAACQWGMLVVLAKLGTPALVGQFALGLAVTAPVVMFTNLQLRALQATDPTPGGNFAPYFTLRLLASAVAVLVVGALALRASQDPAVRAGIFLVGLAKAVEAVSDIFHGRLQQLGNLKWVCISMILKGFLSLAAVAVAVYGTGRLVPVCLLLLASWLAVLLAVDVPCVARAAGRRGPGAWRSLFALCLEPHALKRLLALGLGLGLTAMLISLKVSVPRFALEEYWQDHAVGVYAALASLMQLSGLPAAALGVAASSRLGSCFAGSDWPRLRRLLVGLLTVSFLFGAAGLALALVAGRLLLTVFYSAEYAADHQAFTWLMVAALAGNVCCILNWAVLAARYVKSQIPLHLGVLLVTAAACHFWVPAGGVDGAAWAVTAGSAAQVVATALLLGHAVRSFRRATGADAAGVGENQGVLVRS